MKYAVNLVKNDVPVPGKESIVTGQAGTQSLSGTAVINCALGDRIAIHTQILEGLEQGLKYVGQGCSITVRKVRLN